MGALAQAACGGGGGGGGAAPAGIGSVAVVLAAPGATSVPRQVALDWSVSGAGAAAIDEYRVQMQASDAVDYVQLAAALPASDTTATAALPDLTAIDWAQARIRVQACDAAGTCVASDAQPLVGMLASAVGYLKASNTGTGDGFGWTVALSADGSTLAVAAIGEDSGTSGVNGAQDDETAVESGAVYVFVRGAGGWSQQAYLKASDNDTFSVFGDSLALSSDGSTLAVGASGQGGGGGFNSGAAYVFVRSGTSWTQQFLLEPVHGDAGDRFGVSLALSGDGDTLAVGALGEASAAIGSEGDGTDDTQPVSGAVYVFTRAANGVWSQQEYLKASNTGANDRFGARLALSADGGTLAVGAPREASAATGADGDQSDDSAADAGAVYVFTRVPGPDAVDWAQQAYLKASNTTSSSRFGDALALSADGSTLVVGAPVEDSSATGVNPTGFVLQAADSGAAYVFARSAGVWTQQAYIKASNTDSGDRFASSLALSADGDTLAVGAPFESSAARTVNGAQGNRAEGASSGAAYLFARSVGAWSQRSYVKAPNNDAGDAFGSAVALSADGSNLVVSARREGGASVGLNGDRTSNGTLHSGAVYLY